MVDSSLDNLAANGIINYDADAYIKGTPARYVGSPRMNQYPPFEQPLMVYEPGVQAFNPQMPRQPHQDEYTPKKHTSVNWRNTLLATILGGLGIYGGIKLTKFVNKFRNKKFLNIGKTPTPAPTPATNAAASTATNAATQTAGNTQTSSGKGKWFKDLYKKASDGFAKLPKWGKIATVSLAALTGLYGLYKATTPTNQNQSHY